ESRRGYHSTKLLCMSGVIWYSNSVKGVLLVKTREDLLGGMDLFEQGITCDSNSRIAEKKQWRQKRGFRFLKEKTPSFPARNYLRRHVWNWQVDHRSVPTADSMNELLAVLSLELETPHRRNQRQRGSRWLNGDGGSLELGTIRSR